MEEMYEQGEAVVIDIDVKDYDTETLTDVDSVSFEVYKDGSLIDSGSCGNIGTGEYRGYWETTTNTAVGEYLMVVMISDVINGDIIKKKRFLVVSKSE